MCLVDWLFAFSKILYIVSSEIIDPHPHKKTHYFIKFAFLSIFQISLIQPDLKTQRAECRLNKEHNLEWTIQLGPGEQKELAVKWTAEYPAQEVAKSINLKINFLDFAVRPLHHRQCRLSNHPYWAILCRQKPLIGI